MVVKFKIALILYFLLTAAGNAEAFNSNSAIEFGDRIETCLSRKAIWDEFTKALLNSHQSKLWPNSKSNVHGEGLHENGRIAVKYKLNFFYRPTYNYFISDVLPYESFTYTAMEDHPFTGGAQIEILDDGQTRTLVWEGLYILKNESSTAREIFVSFSQDFFSELKKQFKNFEKEVCH